MLLTHDVLVQTAVHELGAQDSVQFQPVLSAKQVVSVDWHQEVKGRTGDGDVYAQYKTHQHIRHVVDASGGGDA